MDSQPLLDAIDLDDEEQVLSLLKTSHGELCASVVNSKLWLPGWSAFTLLHWAAQRGHVRATSLLLTCGASIHAVDDSGDTVFHQAARFRRAAIFELLMAAAPPHFDFNCTNKDGNTPLHLAAESGAVRIVQLLADTPSCRLNDQNCNGDTPLHLAARYGNIFALKLILTFDSADSTLPNSDGNTPLHLAVMRGKRPSVAALLLCKHSSASLDARNKARATPLLLACSSNPASQVINRSQIGHAPSKDTATKEIVELLLQEGVDVNARDMEGNTALHLAARNGNVDAITALLSSGESHPLMQAPAEEVAGSTSSAATPPQDQHLSVRSKMKADILTFISHAIEAEQLDEISPSPNRKEYFYSTEWRLDRNPSSPDARVNLPNKEGETALHLAAQYGHRAAAEALLDLRAKVNKLNKHLDTPLDYAFKAKHDDIVAVLIRRGAELSSRVKHTLVELALGEVGRTDLKLVPKPRSWDFQDLYLLHTTAMAGRTKILEALLEVEGMDVNARNEWKQTPLHCAAILGKTTVITSLVRRQELRATAEDGRGKTALQYAVECKHSEAEKLLLERVDVKESLDRLYRDRQVFVDAANAVLVGAALIGGVTYSGWLQPPLGYDQGYADLSSIGVRIFWVFNSLSFCFSMCTVLAGAGAILPCPEVYIANVVKEVRRVLALAALLLVLSIVSVLAAFAAAGFAVVEIPDHKNGPILMGASIAPGMSIAFGLMIWFTTKMLALVPDWCTARLYAFLCCGRNWPPCPAPLSHHNEIQMQHQHQSPSGSSSPSPLLNNVHFSFMPASFAEWTICDKSVPFANSDLVLCCPGPLFICRIASLECQSRPCYVPLRIPSRDLRLWPTTG